MPAAPRPVLRARRWSRNRIESLERRRLLSAGDADLAFASGAGVVDVEVELWSTTDALVPAGGGAMLVVGRQAIRRLDASGAIDPSFGANGRITAVSDTIRDVKVLPDGRILVATTQALARYDAQGIPDGSFAPNGWTWVTDIHPSLHAVYQIETQPDGKIILQSYGIGGAKIARLTASAQYDTSFTELPLGLINQPVFGSVNTLAVGGDGKIYFGGHGSTHEGRIFDVIRLNADGGLDESFGDAGYAGSGDADAFVIDGHERVVLIDEPTFGTLALWRLTADGAADTSFGTDSAPSNRTTIDCGLVQSAVQYPRVAIASDGRIMAYDEARLVRLSPDGAFDETFGRVLTLPTSLGGGLYMEGILARDDGSVFVAATASGGTGTRSGVYRLQADGTPPGMISLAGDATLNIVGSEDDDTILIASPGGVGQARMLFVNVVSGFGRSFEYDDVKRIAVSAGGGNDMIVGMPLIGQPITMSGGDGDDRLAGGGGDDSISGNAGRDRLDGRDGNDRLAGNGGRDKLCGSEGSDRLYGGAGDDGLAGQDGDDTMYGGDGDDRFDARLGNDFAHGGSGDDLFTAMGPGRVTLFGDGGTDSADADPDDLLFGIDADLS